MDPDFLRKRGLKIDSPRGEIFVEDSRRNPNTTIYMRPTPFDDTKEAHKTAKAMTPRTALKSAKAAEKDLQSRGIDPGPDFVRSAYRFRRITAQPTYEDRMATKAHNRQVHKNRTRTMGRGGGGGIPNATGLVGKAVEKFFKKV